MLCSRLSSGKNIFNVSKPDIHFKMYFYKAIFFCLEIVFLEVKKQQHRITFNLSYAQEFFSTALYFKGSGLHV